MAVERVVAIGASAGGIPVLRTVVAGFPPNLAAAVLVVLHTGPASPGILPEILGRAGRLPVSHGEDGMPLRPGKVYVAPPDFHMVLSDGVVQLNHGPKENRFRPAVDPLFRSVAAAYGPRAIGVVLSGGLSDGATGLLAIKQSGGITIVQDPEEAPVRDMPESALDLGPVDFTLKAGEIGPLIGRLVREVLPSKALEPPPAPHAEPSSFMCPDCGGPLSEFTEGEVRYFRCEVGHRFSTGALLRAQDDEVEQALWAAVRMLEESALVSLRLAEKASRSGTAMAEESFRGRALDKQRHAAVLRNLLLGSEEPEKRS